MASESKELVVVTNADHVDLYDKADMIPFDKLDLFQKIFEIIQTLNKNIY